MGHTQSTPGHLSIHFFSPLATSMQTRFGAPHPVARVQGPWRGLLVPHGGLPCTIRARKFGPTACHSRSGWLASMRASAAQGVCCLPSKTQPDSGLLMSVYVYACICMYMHVYACICIYIYPAQVNVCICMYTCICMYMYVSVCICEYSRICMYTYVYDVYDRILYVYACIS